jgi:hypothetical protein
MAAAYTIETLRPAMAPETNIRYLPHAYRLAIEYIDATGHLGRNPARLAGLIEHYLAATGTRDLTSQYEDHYRESAEGICKRRFWDWQP